MEAILLDNQGKPAVDDIVRCQVVGDIQILGLENGIPDDLTPYSEHFRTTREGSVTIYIRQGKTKRKAQIYVSTDNGPEATMDL